MTSESETLFAVTMAHVAGELDATEIHTTDPARRYFWRWEQRTDWCGHLIREPDGLSVRVSLDNNTPGKERAEASPSGAIAGVLRSFRDWTSYGTPTPTATFSLRKTLAQIAGDIRRKVINPYATVFPEICQRRDAHAAQDRDAATLAAELAETLGQTVHNNRPGTQRYVRFNTAQLEVHPCGRTDCTIRSLEPDQARRLAAFLATL